MANGTFATAIATKHGTATLGTPVYPTLPIRAPWHQTPVRACGAQAVTTHAPLRSRWTKAASVCDAQVLRAGDAPPSPLKIQGWRQSAASGCWAGSLGRGHLRLPLLVPAWLP